MDARYASRKFILACVSLLLAWVAFAFRLITSDQVLNFSQWIVGLYMAGNVGDTFVTKGGSSGPAQ